MRKRVQLALGGLLLVLGGAITWQVIRLREPTYLDKPLSVWVEGYNPDADAQQVDEAVLHIGTNAIPFFLDELQAKDSALKLTLTALGMHFTPAETRHLRAEKGFSALGPVASNAVPALIAIYAANTSVSARKASANSLVEIGFSAKAAIPALIKSAGDTNSEVRAFAVYTLGRMALEPEIVDPVLIRSLRDSDREVRYNAAFGLGALAFVGKDARAAVPALVETLKDSYATARAAAAMALGHIHAEPMVVVPALTQCLRDPQAFVRSQAAAALGKFGMDAKPAFGALTELLHDENPDAKNAAFAALRAIDPDVAAKGIVK